MLCKVNRDALLKVLGMREYRRALAFAIFLKDRFSASVVKGWSYRDLSRITGLSPNTCKTRIHTLRDMHLVREYSIAGVPYLQILSLRSRKVRTKSRDKEGKIRIRVWDASDRLDTRLEKIDRSSVKSIEQGLMAMLIVETQKRKDYIQHLTELSSGCVYGATKKQIDAARKEIVGNGWKNFCDRGFSLKGICRRLKCTTKTATGIIALGERLGLFVAHRSLRLSEKVAEIIESKNGYTTNEVFTYCNIKFIQPCTYFSLIP